MNWGFLSGFIVGFFIVSALQAQPLRRKASLGIVPAPVENGIAIEAVTGGTARALGLKQKDVIVSMNSKPIAQMNDLMQAMNGQKAGDAVEIGILREGKSKTLKGKFQPKELETSAVSDVLYDDAPYKQGRLRVIVNKPYGKERYPAMLFIPGYTCTSIDNLPDYHPYKRVIDAYVKAGFVSLRIEKSGLGDSENTPACESCDLYDEIENFRVGLRKLKSLPYVDTSKIIIVGHSMGGIVAPAIAAKERVAGVVVYGTTAKSWFEYQIEMYRVQNLLAGMDPLEYEASIVSQYDLNYRFFVEKASLEDLAKDTAKARVLREQWMYDGQGKIYSRNANYWRQIQDVPHLQHWKDTQAKVLVQYGASDFQAFSLADHEQIVRTVNYYKPGTATLKTYPETDHYFAKSGSMQQAFDLFNQGQYQKLFDLYNTAVGADAVNWSLEVIR